MLRVILVTVWNSGNVPIDKTEFEAPISFCQASTARGNAVTVGEIVSAPEASKPELYVYEDGHHSNRLALKNMLFNQKDSVTVKIVIADYGGENLPIDIAARIKV